MFIGSFTRNQSLQVKICLALLIQGPILSTLAYETVQNAAIIARTLVDFSSTSIATMATVFPTDEPGLGDQPFSLQEYYASCHQNGSLTLLFLPISRHSRNIQRSSNHYASISISSEVPAASHPRVSLMGNVTVYRDQDSIPNVAQLRRCYLEKHPDARWWLPGDDGGAHISYWARFDPQNVYFVGGFGGQHYIGFIPLGLYQESKPSRSVMPPQEPGLAGRLFFQQD